MLLIKKLARELVEKTKNISKKEQEKIVRSLVYYLGSRGTSKYFPQLIREIEKLTAQRSPLNAIVESAHVLDKKTLHDLERELQEIYGQIGIEARENKELLGGVRIKIGDTVIDASMKNRLHQLELQMNN